MGEEETWILKSPRNTAGEVEMVEKGDSELELLQGMRACPRHKDGGWGTVHCC